jgi:hypothetical protein
MARYEATYSSDWVGRESDMLHLQSTVPTESYFPTTREGVLKTCFGGY